MGVEMPQREQQFLGCPAHSKELEVSAAVFPAKGIFESPITVRCVMYPFVKIL